MKSLTKLYQVWERGNMDGEYRVTEYDTLLEALTSHKYTDDWYLTKRVIAEARESDDYGHGL